MKFVNSYEDYNAEGMRNMLCKFDLLDFVRIVSHLEFCAEHTDFKDNTVYFFCKFVAFKDHPLPFGEGWHIDNIPIGIPQQREYSSCHPDIYRHISFKNKDHIIGWYNIDRNILWLSDLFHHARVGEAPLWKILDIVEGYKHEKCFKF